MLNVSPGGIYGNICSTGNLTRITCLHLKSCYYVSGPQRSKHFYHTINDSARLFSGFHSAVPLLEVYYRVVNAIWDCAQILQLLRVWVADSTPIVYVPLSIVNDRLTEVASKVLKTHLKNVDLKLSKLHVLKLNF